MGLNIVISQLWIPSHFIVLYVDVNLSTDTTASMETSSRARLSIIVMSSISINLIEVILLTLARNTWIRFMSEEISHLQMPWVHGKKEYICTIMLDMLHKGYSMEKTNTATILLLVQVLECLILHGARSFR